MLSLGAEGLGESMSDKNREELKKKATAYHEEAQSSAAITEPASGSPVRARGDTV